MMTASYYRFVRREIESLLPPSASLIVDVGCGEGLTAAWLKSRYPGSTTIGLEGNPELSDRLAANVDEAKIVDLNGPLPDVGAPDLLLFLDVLEHLARPETVLSELTANMPADGTVIISVPNIAHLSVSLPLFMRNEFAYRDAGILDRTHLRFFVLRSAISLLSDAGFTVTGGIRLGFDGPRTKLLDWITFGLLREKLTKQYILAATRQPVGVSGNVVRWRNA
jgi:SAM-dependent methyltransferase